MPLVKITGQTSLMGQYTAAKVSCKAKHPRPIPYRVCCHAYPTMPGRLLPSTVHLASFADTDGDRCTPSKFKYNPKQIPPSSHFEVQSRSFVEIPFRPLISMLCMPTCAYDGASKTDRPYIMNP